MKPEDLIGIRPEELDESTRQQQRLILDDPQALEEHTRALALGDRLEGLRPTGGPTFDAFKKRRSEQAARSWRKGPYMAAVSVLAMAAAVVLVVFAGPDDSQNRGVDDDTLGLHVELAVEGALGVRAFTGPDDSVRQSERLLFRITTLGAGTISIEEGDPQVAVFPVEGVWTVDPGVNIPMIDGTVMAFRTDAGPGRHLYRVTFCQQGVLENCVVETVEVDWE